MPNLCTPQASTPMHWIVIPSSCLSLLDCKLQESRAHVWLVQGGFPSPRIDPLLSASQRGCDGETLGKPSLCACVWLLMRGGRSSCQLGASWLSSTEVKPVSWTDSLLQGRRADQVLRQMEPRLVLIYPKVSPPMRRVERTTSPSVLSNHRFFFKKIFLGLLVSHLKMKNNV